MAFPKAKTAGEKYTEALAYWEKLQKEFPYCTPIAALCAWFIEQNNGDAVAGYLAMKAYWEGRERSWKAQGIRYKGAYLTAERFVHHFDMISNGKCDNPHCQGPGFWGVADPMACADHCHITREFRGILCADCNYLEGRLFQERRIATMSETEKLWFQDWSDRSLRRKTSASASSSISSTD